MNPSLQDKIDQILQKASPSTLRRAREALTETYRNQKSSQSVFADEAQRLAYLGSRFPATYAVCESIFKELLARKPDLYCETFLDLGAGFGTASLAAMECFSQLKKVELIEQSSEAISLGTQFLDGASTKWIQQDLQQVQGSLKGDLAFLSYSLGELSHRLPLFLKLAESEIPVIAIVEPGTPRGYQVILEARDFFLQRNYQILAPCPHAEKCPLKTGDWCHFYTRLPRNSLQRLLKEGQLGYEDEKFSYLILSKDMGLEKPLPRILRYPQKGSGFVKLKLCDPSGIAREEVITRKDKALYKQARKSDWGDVWDCGKGCS